MKQLIGILVASMFLIVSAHGAEEKKAVPEEKKADGKAKGEEKKADAKDKGKAGEGKAGEGKTGEKPEQLPVK